MICDVIENMKASVLFSGGKDSALAAAILAEFFKVELITCTFGTMDNWKKAQEAAQKMNMPFRLMKLDKEILDQAAEITIRDNFPSNAIKHIHQKALEKLAQESKIIADGIRRDDRAPIMSLGEIKSLEDKFDIHYVQPLSGYSRKTINILVEKLFKIKEYKSAEGIGAEYEFELRNRVKNKNIFPPKHTQTIVLEIKRKIC